MKLIPFGSISANLLAAGILAASLSVGCSSNSSETKDEQAVQKSSQNVPQSAERENMQKYLPESNDSEWSVAEGTRYFVADNLWEYIDGGAEGYLVFGFKAVLAADVTNKASGKDNTLDIYNMGTPKNSFGIYSAERSYDADYIDVGIEGYLSGNTLNFYLGPYYVKLTSFEESEQARNDLMALARSVEARMGIKREPPRELTVFPTDGLVNHSIRYHSANVLGQSDLKNGFTADYQVGDNEFKLFFILHDNIRQANESFESYMAYMQKSGKNQEIYNHGETPWFAADDPYYGKVITEQSGRVVLGILEAPDAETASEYLQNMRLNLVSLGLI